MSSIPIFPFSTLPLLLPPHKTSNQPKLIKNKRPYLKIEDERRTELLKMVKEEKIGLKEASRKLNINYFSAKTIMQTFRKKGRIHKKLTRDRKKKFISQITKCVSLEKSIEKPIFLIEKANLINTERSSGNTASEDGEKQEKEIKMKFDFGIYKKDIEYEFDKHLGPKLDMMKKQMERSLPCPSNYNSIQTDHSIP